MYKIPGSEKRAFIIAHRDATVKAARTSWGKKRTEKFFDHFLQTGEILNRKYPIAAVRYSLARDAKLDKTPYEGMQSNAPLTEDEKKYVWGVRRLAGLRNGSIPANSYWFGDRRIIEILTMEGFLAHINEILTGVNAGVKPADSR